MKRIIEGKRYDTETAELVHEWDNGLGYSDFGNYAAELYRTKAGNWFLHGEGGPMSPAAQPAVGGGTSGGEHIDPMTAEEAFVWLQTHDGEKAAENHFADKIVDA